MREAFTIGNTRVRPGGRAAIDIRVPDLYTHTGMTLPVQVVHGRRDGPRMFLSAALHGDEINGVEIIRRIMHEKALNRLRGTLIAVPVVNIYGFISKSRYLPDRRDLNRSFPGSEEGSTAARMANLFLTEIAAKCTHGIDLHTGAIHRENLPQVRAWLDDADTERMARAFSLPVILNTGIVDGSLRQAVEKMGLTVIVYEAGEALRFDEVAIRAGVNGVISVMRAIGMLPPVKRQRRRRKPLVAISSTWVRAPQSGILRASKPLGAQVRKGERLGVVSDPFGDNEKAVKASAEGIIIGRTTIPLVNEGEALFHIARFESPETVAGHVEEIQQELNPATDELPPAEPPIV
ncbi:MAG: succinylglutamate desuccinylase/aspartoacylase family protein [Gammaproteobacteria bacterium]|nr:succinylglutamate desuccinylase/aspartoacylase family protein [Gammaproteobacteria bacterium]